MYPEKHAVQLLMFASLVHLLRHELGKAALVAMFAEEAAARAVERAS